MPSAEKKADKKTCLPNAETCRLVGCFQGAGREQQGSESVGVVGLQEEGDGRGAEPLGCYTRESALLFQRLIMKRKQKRGANQKAFGYWAMGNIFIFK